MMFENGTMMGDSHDGRFNGLKIGKNMIFQSCQSKNH